MVTHINLVNLVNLQSSDAIGTKYCLVNIQVLHIPFLSFCLFCVNALHHSQQFFSYVGMFFWIPGSNKF